MKAIDDNLIDVVRYCVSRATFENLQALDSYGNTAVVLACRKFDHFQCLEEILRSDASFSRSEGMLKDVHNDINATAYGNGKTLLQAVCSDGGDLYHIVEILVQKGATLNIRDAQGLTPLMICAAKGHVKSLAALLSSGADPNIAKNIPANNGSGKQGRTVSITALHFATTGGHFNCVHELISHGANIWKPNGNGETLLMLASASGWINIVKKCLDNGSSEQVNAVDNFGNNAVMHACHKEGNLSSLLCDARCLEQVNVVSSDFAMTPLMMAAFKGCLYTVKLLLEYGADPNLGNDRGETALLIVVGKEPLPKSSRLTSTNACIPLDSEQCLEFVDVLLKHGANINLACKAIGETALTIAIKRNAFKSTIMELLRQGADVNKAELDGSTPLKYAVKIRCLYVIKQLLEFGASVGEKALHGMSSESLKFLKNETRRWKLLVQAGFRTTEVEKITKRKFKNITLARLCRIPARQHVMNSFPDSNLFYMIPRLNLPEPIKEIILGDLDKEIVEECELDDDEDSLCTYNTG